MKIEIKDFPGYVIDNNGGVYKNNKLIKSFNRKGYKTVTLSNKGYRKHLFIHRLVAAAFIPNPENKPCIDHIDGDRTNNHVSNLRWVTQLENCNNPITKERYINYSGEKHKLSKAVKMIKNGVVVRVYKSMRLAEKDGFNAALICSCCRGRRLSHKNYNWEYESKN